MIPEVAFLDATYALAAFSASQLAPSRWARRLCGALAVYCLIEMCFHVPMEELAAKVMLWIY